MRKPSARILLIPLEVFHSCLFLLFVPLGNLTIGKTPIMHQDDLVNPPECTNAVFSEPSGLISFAEKELVPGTLCWQEAYS